jgi:hypothetical protein
LADVAAVKSRNIKGSLFLTGIGLSLCLVSGIFLWLMTRSYMRSQAMTQWPKHSALILDSGVRRIDWAEGMPPSYEPHILYRYRVAETDHESERLGLRGSPRFKNQQQAAYLAKDFIVGQMVTCWVSPADPTLSLLKLDSRAAGYSLWFPGLFFLGGVGMIYGAWKPR